MSFVCVNSQSQRRYRPKLPRAMDGRKQPALAVLTTPHYYSVRHIRSGMENYYSQQMPVDPISLGFSTSSQEPQSRKLSDVDPGNHIGQPRHDSFLQTRGASSACSRAWSCIMKGSFLEYDIICGDRSIRNPRNVREHMRCVEEFEIGQYKVC